MRTKNVFSTGIFILVSVFMYAQTCNTPTVFTWEGAYTGNKAVWKVNDTLQTYSNINGVDVQLRLIDPFNQNTDTGNPSEFNDYTKTNTFYGRGAFAFQITAEKHNQPVCLEFTFSKPIILKYFNIWDIDFLAASLANEHTFQDSLSFFADINGKSVPVQIIAQKPDHSFRIIEQSVISDYIQGVNGDLRHNDSLGYVVLNTVEMINKLTICYANGSLDDGISNSQAMKITDFGFCEVKGSVSGFVLEETTNRGLVGSKISLFHENGDPVLDEGGNQVTTWTDSRGYYIFVDIPVGNYIVRSLNAPGYDSISDMDDLNDDKVVVSITPEDIDLDLINFYDKMSVVLPVNLTNWAINRVEGGILVSWNVAREVNSDYYTIQTSVDGINFEETGRQSSKAWSGNSNTDYTFFLYHDLSVPIYIKLIQVDFDGKSADFGIKYMKGTEQKTDITIFPNPADRSLNLTMDGVQSADIKILDIKGQIYFQGVLNGTSMEIPIDMIPNGTYFLQVVTTDEQVITKKFVKQ